GRRKGPRTELASTAHLTAFERPARVHDASCQWYRARPYSSQRRAALFPSSLGVARRGKNKMHPAVYQACRSSLSTIVFSIKPGEGGGSFTLKLSFRVCAANPSGGKLNCEPRNCATVRLTPSGI